MMNIEVPVLLLQDEVIKLSMTANENEQRAYARGAIDALTWILSGSKAPSEGGSTSIPVTCTGAYNVH